MASPSASGTRPGTRLALEATPGAMRKAIPWILGALALFVVLVVVAVTTFVDEPLRRGMERDLNATLKGYSVRIRALRFHPLGWSIELIDAVVRQQANPEPPVAWFPKLSASVHW